MKLPFNNKPAMVAIIAIFLGLFLLGAATQCRADGYLDFEVGYTTLRSEVPAIGMSVEGPQVGPGDMRSEFGVFLIAPYEYRGKEYGNQAIIHAMLVDGLGPVDIGVGPAYLQNVDAINGSHFNFSLMARWRVTDRLTLSWRHWSNAGTVKPNLGRDMVTIGYRF